MYRPDNDPTSLASTLPARHSALRRQLFRGAVALFGGALLPSRAARASARTEGYLSFVHTHTRETLAVRYASGGTFSPEALAALDWFLRDFRNGLVHRIDPLLFDQLRTLAEITGTQAPFQVISGYRSPATNGALRARGGGVAAHSLHLDGRAIDIRLADIPLADVRDAALSLRMGGVGYYPASQFVHVDTGAVRNW